MQRTTSLVVYTDLDGTLLDHETYSWDAARPALKRLASLDVPIVLASSKTAQEIRRFQAEMELTGFPAIVENGAGVLYPVTRGTQDEDAYTKIRTALNDLPPSLRASFRGFGDMSNEQVAEITGLPLSQASLAKHRQYSEPGLWSGSEAERLSFLNTLEQCGIAARDGGRFMTLSFGKTKKDRMGEINARLRPDTTVALGDAPNDVEMLEFADFGFIVSNPHSGVLPTLEGETEGRIRRSELAGPSGWNACMNALLDNLNMQKGEPAIG